MAAVVAAAGDAVADVFGLSWRPELAAGILTALDRIELVEVIADDWLDADGRRLSALRTLSAQVPVSLHALGLGLASAYPVNESYLARLARLIDYLRPASWSEHLAFVRAGGVEIGHLAAPPRTPATIDGTARNVERARRVVGSLPRLENIATLLEPPGSTMDEVTWLNAVLAATGAELLLDLHNLHANATNFGFDAAAAVQALPAARIRAVHLAGGRRLAGGRILDDHLHPVPDEVMALLDVAGAHVAQPLDVILERDGAFPPMSALLSELATARAALVRGRARRQETIARAA